MTAIETYFYQNKERLIELKILIAKTLIIIMMINLLFVCTSFAENVDIKVYFDNELITYGDKNVEKVDDDYYLNSNFLRYYNDFTYREADGEIFIRRYGTELKITFGSDSVSINGKAILFTTPVYRTNDYNYISLKLIASVFGSEFNMDEASQTIKITLNQKPVLPLVKSVGGSISLPDGAVAPSSGIAFKITATRNDVYSDVNVKYVLIDSGQNSANFQLPIENDSDTYSEYTVSYQIIDGYQFDDYVEQGYYSYNGTRSSENKQSHILLSENTNINLNVIDKKLISGTVNLNGCKEDSVYIAISSDRYNDGSYVENSKFSLFIPSDAERAYLEYHIFSSSNYIQNGYYSKNGTVPFYDDENYIDVMNDDISNINFDILKGKMITGTVSFPESAKNTKVGFTISGEINNRTILDEWYTKPEGTTQVEYSFVVPSYDNNKYLLQFSQNDWSGYITAEGKISQDKTLAKEFDVTNGDSFVQDISVEQPKLYGVISLPNNELSPSGGIDVAITLSNYYENETSITVNIPEGQNNTNYKFPVSYELLEQNYLYLDCSAQEGRYSYSDVLYSNDIGVAKQVDITLDKMTKVSGVISLAQNQVAPKALDIDVYTYGSGDAHVTIPQGENNIEYSMMVKSNESSYICYKISNAEEYLNGYYTKDGTVTSDENAEQLDFSEDQSGIDMQISMAPYISGTISLPQGISAYNEDMEIGISTRYCNSNVTLPKGETSVTYKLYVQAETLDEVDFMQYDLNSELYPELSPFGYYSENGTTSRYDSIDDLFSGTKAEDINITLIKNIEVTGTIKLPDNKLAPKDIPFDINAYGNGSWRIGETTIKRGDNSSTYQINIPEDYNLVGYKLMYYSYGCEGFYHAGYYNENGTTSIEDNAEIIKNRNNIAITVLNVCSVTGAITNSIASSDSIDITVTAETIVPTAEYIGSNRFDIEGGNSTSAYTLDIPADVTNFIVRYDIYNSPGSSIFKNEGFYNSSKQNCITFDSEEAQTLNVNDKPNINFTLPLASTDVYTLVLENIYDKNDQYYDVKDENSNADDFTVKVLNKTEQDTEGIVFVSRYDKDNKLIEVVAKKAALPKQTLSNVVLKFEGDRFDQTDHVKATVWDEMQHPLAMPIDYYF